MYTQMAMSGTSAGEDLVAMSSLLPGTLLSLSAAAVLAEWHLEQFTTEVRRVASGETQGATAFNSRLCRGACPQECAPCALGFRHPERESVLGPAAPLLLDLARWQWPERGLANSALGGRFEIREYPVWGGIGSHRAFFEAGIHKQ